VGGRWEEQGIKKKRGCQITGNLAV